MAFIEQKPRCVISESSGVDATQENIVGKVSIGEGWLAKSELERESKRSEKRITAR
jgi:hypothetical protein